MLGVLGFDVGYLKRHLDTATAMISTYFQPDFIFLDGNVFPCQQILSFKLVQCVHDTPS